MKGARARETEHSSCFGMYVQGNRISVIARAEARDLQRLEQLRPGVMNHSFRTSRIRSRA